MHSWFGDAIPFKVQLIFYIPLFEGHIDADALDNWLNVLEGYFSVHNFSDREKITFAFLKENIMMIHIYMGAPMMFT